MNKVYILRFVGAVICMIALAMGVGFYFASYYQAQTRPDVCPLTLAV